MTQSDTLTRADMADKINKQVGLSRSDAAQIIESLLGHITDALYAGENVKKNKGDPHTVHRAICCVGFLSIKRKLRSSK